jgi:tetratricopeptide (TPR) repeat protein
MRNYKDLIDRYLDGELEGEKLHVFNDMLAEDPEFRKEVQLQKEIRQAVAEDDVLTLRKKLQRIAASEDNKTKSRIKVTYAIAAAVIGIVLIAGSWFLLKQFNPSPDELYARYYTPYENVYSVRSAVTQNTMEQSAIRAFRNYDMKNWAEAETNFAGAINNNPDNISYLFYSGIVKLELNKTNEALSHFNKVIQQEQGLFTQQAYWYISLACLKSGDIGKAKDYLNRIVQNEMARQEEAESLLDKLPAD